MAKGQLRSGREKKKPKSDKPKKGAPGVSPFSAPQPSGKRDQGGKKAH